MTSAYRKKLIEVALPLDAINKEAAREKSIRHGHPSTLHLWWARRPLAACRAVLFASLVDDPGNDLPEKEAEIERKRLFGIIEELVLWENSNDERVLHAARTEIARSTARTAGVNLPAGDLTPAQVREALEKYAPPVLDPFCGGGSIPLEAQRLGLKAYASDLNPVAVLITKALIEIPPKFAGLPPVHPRQHKELFASEWNGAAGLAEDVRYYGQWMRDEAYRRIGHLFPRAKVPPELGAGEATVIAWLWTRTIQCPNPACKAWTPLIRSFWLSKKKDRPAFAVPVIDRKQNVVRFRIETKGQPGKETSNRISAECLFCGTQIKKAQLRELAVQNGIREVPFAMICDGSSGRTYLPFTVGDVPFVERPNISAIDHVIANDHRWYSPPLYGLSKFEQLFTTRQLVALNCLSQLVDEVRVAIQRDLLDVGASGIDQPTRGRAESKDYADAVATYLALAVSKNSHYWSNLATWHSGRETMQGVFARQAMPMVWDFAECNMFSTSSGSFLGAVEWNARVLEQLPATVTATASQLDATVALALVDKPLISTDPPYYDNIGYADLSDFFYMWLRRSLGSVYPDLFSTVLVPKARELVAAPYRFEGNKERADQFFEHGLKKAFDQMQHAQSRLYPLTIYYAFKQAETDTADDSFGSASTAVASTGWETMLEGLLSSGISITGTWPMRTEMAGRAIGRLGTNILASSIILVCRLRPESASLATRREFVAALKKEFPAALVKLTHGSVAPVDLAQASIGPGMAVFSRYAKVMEADGATMSVRIALQIINQELDEYLTQEEGALDRETRFALAWFQQFSHDEGAFGDADVLARAKDTAVEAMVRAGILHSRAGKVRLLRHGELEEDWDPRIDARLTVWECTQQLIRRLNDTGEAGAARLLKQLGGGRGEEARALAYRLYAICERKKWSDEALAYNALAVSWPEIEKKTAGIEGEVEQGRLL
jgi:putative DNA methylase